LSTIKILKKHRGQGHGSEALYDFIRFCKVLDIDYLVLKPAPLKSKLSKEKRKKKIEKLINFYGKFGLKVVDVKDDEPIMYVDVDVDAY